MGSKLNKNKQIKTKDFSALENNMQVKSELTLVLGKV